MVTHAVTSSNDVAHYTCSVTTDVYVRGTTDVTCTNADDWPTATILCAPTTCWYRHSVHGPVYRGTIARTPRGYDCQPWALNTPQTKNTKYDQSSMYPSDNDDKVAASNFCRIFDDGADYVWCYENRNMGPFNLRYYEDCGVNRCQEVPGQRSP
ncbi:hypothetical protein V1264_002970 [Littorina saxatilis]|uniref:Kringle domain-containing protein n=1 Tax=Littorina saxatilis TaxID=31220 RepID=A0AAN9G8Q4_9CAEN